MSFHTTIICLALFTCLRSGAAVMIQQENIAGGAYHFSAEGFGQSFITDKGFTASGIELFLKASPFGAFKTTVSLYEYGATTQTFGTLTPLAIGVIDSKQIPTIQSWVLAQFSTPVTLKSKKTYAFRVTDGMSSSNQFYFSSGNAYADGAWLNIGSGGLLTERSIDSSFRIQSVPEPSSFSLLSIFFASCLVRRSRRKRVQNKS